MANSKQQAIGVIKEVHGPVVVNCKQLKIIQPALSATLNNEICDRFLSYN